MWTGIDTTNLSHMSDCKSYFMLELQMYAKVMGYTPVRSLGFLNVCMLGKQLALYDTSPPNQTLHLVFLMEDVNQYS